jgi:hypothetical protein
MAHEFVQVNERVAAFGTRFPVLVNSGFAFGTIHAARKHHGLLRLDVLKCPDAFFAVTPDTAGIGKSLFQERFVCFLRDSPFLPQFFATLMAHETIMIFHRFMHGPCGGAFTMANAPVLGL